MIKVFFILLSLSCAANSFEDTSDYKEKIETTQKKLVAQEEKKRKVLAELYEINQAIKKIQYRKERYINEAKFINLRIKKANLKMVELENHLSVQKIQLNQRLRSLYKFSGHGFLRTIFSTQSAADLDRNLKMLKIVSDRDYKLLQSYKSNRVHYGKEKRRLSYMMNRISHLESQIKYEEKQLLEKQNAKSDIISNLDESTIASLLELKNLRVKTVRNNIREEIPKVTFMESKGQMSPPVDAILEKSFGVYIDKRIKAKTRLKGVVYKTSFGQQVRSIFRGKVAYVGVVAGHGLTAIVSHGNHYYSVYSNLSKSFVSNGQSVESKQVLGSVGKNSQLYGQSFYFEIRHFSDPLNPTEWISHEASAINANTNAHKEKINYGS